ncbi:uncharacterized protein J3R85_010642 [Psidium guajava]|nr:uncharacterized protein J3R85_010642 [Psidium guajava]
MVAMAARSSSSSLSTTVAWLAWSIHGHAREAPLAMALASWSSIDAMTERCQKLRWPWLLLGASHFGLRLKLRGRGSCKIPDRAFVPPSVSICRPWKPTWPRALS